MRLLIVNGPQGESSWAYEAPTHDSRQWRCCADNFVLAAPTDTAHVDTFIAAMLNHAKIHTGGGGGITVVDT